MANQFVTQGADPGNSQWAPISQTEFFTGYWSLRNPLRDAAVPYLQGKFYSASRIDSIWGGQNIELSPALVPIRRYGTTAYNSQTFPAVQTYQEFKIAGVNTPNRIQILVDTASAVFDGTGPSTKTTIFNKSAGAVQSGFVQVGNIMYIGDGVDAKQYLQSGFIWQANYAFPAGEFLVDTNQNVQLNLGYAATISNVAISNSVATVTVSELTHLQAGALVSIYNMQTLTDLESQVLQVVSASASSGSGTFTAIFNYPNYSSTADQGYACSQGVNGTTSGSAPTWQSAHRGYTLDGTSLWSQRGPQVRNWGINQPLIEPRVGNVMSTSPGSQWAASTYYLPQPYISVTVSATPYIFQLTTNGTTNGSVPVFTSGLGSTVTDGTAVWTNVGPAARQTAHAYKVGDIIAVSWNKTSVVQTGVGTSTGASGGYRSAPNADPTPIGQPARRSPVPTGFPAPTVAKTNQQINPSIIPTGVSGVGRGGGGITVNYAYTGFFMCKTAGTSSATATAGIAWNSALNSTVNDGKVVWTHVGVTVGRTSAATSAPTITVYTQATGNIGNTQLVTNVGTIIDSNGNLEDVLEAGKSAATVPTWATTLAAQTLDGSLTWVNKGLSPGLGGTAANTLPWQYCYAYVDSVTGDVGPASPLSAPIILQAGRHIEISGDFSTDPHIDAVNIYRTEQGQSVPFLIAQIFNVASLTSGTWPTGTAARYTPMIQGTSTTGTQGTWVYDDYSPDFGSTGSTMNNLLSADLVGLNSPPPDGFIPLAYHLGAIWGIVNNTIYYSAGPLQDNGFGGNEAFPPSQFIAFESEVTNLWSTNFGLYSFLVDSINLIAGTGSPFAISNVANDIGLKHRNCFSLNGQTPFVLTSDGQVCIVDPNTGAATIGFPIGDQLATFNPQTSYVTWHVYGTDQKLFVSDGSTGWYSMLGSMAPESGQAWDTKTNIVGGCSAVKSVETSPGVHQLLVGPASSGQILYRDVTTNADNGTAYTANVIFGAAVLAAHSEMAEIGFVAADLRKSTGTLVPTVSVLTDEIQGWTGAPSFTTLTNVVNDPPKLAASSSVWAKRWYMTSSGSPCFCRFFMLQFGWSAVNSPDQLLSMTLYGRIHKERRNI